MQIPASNLLPDRLHRFVGNSRTEIDEELPPSDSSISSAETCSPENRTSRSDMSFACHHPCNRRSSSSPDEVPARTPSNARLGPPISPALLPLSCNARWHRRRTAQTDFADISPASIDQKHSAGTDSLTEG